MKSKEERWREIYQSLDKNADGKIDFKELVEALQQRMQKDRAISLADLIFRRKTLVPTPDCTIDFKEFVEYMVENEAKLALVFKEIDINRDGTVEAPELKGYMENMGINVSMDDAERIVRRMTILGKVVDLNAFQQAMMPNLSSDPLDIAMYWQHSLIVDVGEDTLAPENFTLEQFKRSTWWKHLVAGGIAGAVSRSMTAPLDRLKIFMQVHASHTNPIGILTGFRMMLKEGGMKSLWRGNGVNVLKIAPETALKFTFYDNFKRLIKGDKSRELTILERFAAGSAAGALAQTILYPMEVLKTRLALRKTGEMNRGIVNAAFIIYKHEGLKAFFRGYTPNLLGIIPYAGIDLAVYETIKKLYSKQFTPSTTEPNVAVVLACGAFSAVCGQVTSFPLAIVKTKLQAHVIGKTSTGHRHPTTTVGQFRWIITQEGFRGLYRGLAPGALKIIPAVSTSYVVYECMRKYLGATMA